MTIPETFFWGFLGSIAVEIVAAAHDYNSSGERLPDKYKRIDFYILRVLLAVVAGGLAVAYQIDKAILAFNIGAATPLIIQEFTTGMRGVHRPYKS